MSKSLSLLVGVGRVPGDIGRLALEEIGNKDLIVVVSVGGGQDVCTLDCLRVEAEDIVDDEDSFAGIRRASNVFNDCQYLASLDIAGYIQVFRPPIVSYFPLPSYPLEMIGGMLQQAAL